MPRTKPYAWMTEYNDEDIAVYDPRTFTEAGQTLLDSFGWVDTADRLDQFKREIEAQEGIELDLHDPAHVGQVLESLDWDVWHVPVGEWRKPENVAWDTERIRRGQDFNARPGRGHVRVVWFTA